MLGPSQAFSAVDASGNGTLGATELARLFAEMGNPMSFEKLVAIMQDYDKDQSGQVCSSFFFCSCFGHVLWCYWPSIHRLLCLHIVQIEFNEFMMMFRNQLLDLQAVRSFIGTLPKDRDETKKVGC
jgi:hypothetical protein